MTAPTLRLVWLRLSARIDVDLADALARLSCGIGTGNVWMQGGSVSVAAAWMGGPTTSFLRTLRHEPGPHFERSVPLMTRLVCGGGRPVDWNSGAPALTVEAVTHRAKRRTRWHACGTRV